MFDMSRIQLQVNGLPMDDWLADTLTEFPDAMGSL